MPDSQNAGSSGLLPVGKSARRRPRHKRGSGKGGSKSSQSNAFAAVDLGTNNCRLLIAKEAGVSFRIIDSYSRVVRLGKGLAATGRLSDESMDAAVEALGVCASRIKSKRVKRWRCVATEACRRASNGEEFLKRVKDETGISLEIISPRVESRLAVMGCLNLVDPTKDVALVVDIGGGSTELRPYYRNLRVARDMGSRTFEERAAEPCIGSDRASLLVAGCAITDVLCEMWPSKMIRVADRGLREGMLIGLMQKTQKPHLLHKEQASTSAANQEVQDGS